MDLSRFSFSEKEGDPITANRALPHKAFCKEGQQGRLQQVTRSPLPKAAQDLGVFYNLLEGKSKNTDSGRAPEISQINTWSSKPTCKKGVQPKFSLIDKAV